MSKRDYELLAEMISVHLTMASVSAEGTAWLNTLARSMAVAFKIDNPRFDEAKWFKACGISEMSFG